MKHEYKVGDKVDVVGSDWVADGTYSVVQVDAEDKDTPVKVTSNCGEWWIANDNITLVSTPAPTTDQYIRILETLAGDDIVEMACNIHEALQ